MANVGTALLPITIIVGIGMGMVILVTLGFIFAKQEAAALKSDSATQCEGSVTDVRIESGGEDGPVHILLYQFHVADQLGGHGSRVTGKLTVSQEKYDLHGAVGFPKACVVRYVKADPRRNRLVAIGDDDNPSVGGPDHQWKLNQWAFAFIFSWGWLLGAVRGAWMSWQNMNQGIFLGLVGVFSTLVAVMRVRIRMRLRPFPGARTVPYNDFKIYKLDAPYEIPVPHTHWQPSTAGAPAGALAVQMPLSAPEVTAPAPSIMQVALPGGCIAGQVLQVAAPTGAIISLTVPPNATGGQVVQVQY